MSKTNPTDPVNHVASYFDNETQEMLWGHVGLTKREYISALVLQGLATRQDLSGESYEAEAVRRADALIAELNKEPAKPKGPNDNSDGGLVV